MPEHPREARARDNRAKILTAATSVIEQEGTMASLNEIAKRAGVGPATLYRHFPNREALLGEVLTTWVQRVRDDAAGWSVSSRADLVDWLERLTEIANAYSGLAATVASTLGEDDAMSPLHDAHNATLEAIDDVFGRARAAGLVDGPVDAVTVARLITGVAMVTEQADLPRDQLLQLLGVTLDGVIASTPAVT